MNELITGNHERIANFLSNLDRLIGNVEQLSAEHRPMLDGERYLTDKEVAELIKVSRRTLQEYRNNGIIPYIQLGGKILYRESDIERMLRENHRKAYRWNDYQELE